MGEQVRAGSLAALRTEGQLRCKIGSHPVVVFWHDERAYAIEDRCPHMGFPLRRGTVEAGLVTCHWHHARFDLESGCTLDPFADDAVAFDVAIDGDDVLVAPRGGGDTVAHLRDRLRDGLEEGLTLVIAKAVLGLLAAGVPPAEIVGVGTDFAVRNREDGWGSGLTVLTAMANLAPQLDEADRALALVQALAFLSGDVRGRPPRFPLDPLRTEQVPAERLAGWYRRFVDTRSPDAAERTLATAVDTQHLDVVEAMMFAAVTDHVFIDEGHTIDFTNKAFELLAHLGKQAAPDVLPTLVSQTALATRHEERSDWRHPDDLAGMVADAERRLPELLAVGERATEAFSDVGGLGWRFLADDPEEVLAALEEAIRAGATPEQLGRATAYAAALRLVRFHTQNDHADWNVVHHAFTSANALHQALARNPTPELLRGVVHGVLRVYLDRFLNVPAARLPRADHGDLDALAACWDVQGAVDDAGRAAYGYLAGGGDPAVLVAHLGRALLREDAGFHWFQVVEAGVRQFHAWPAGSEEGRLVLTGVTRFLAAHTPTRRERSTVFDIATRLRRGEALYEEL